MTESHKYRFCLVLAATVFVQVLSGIAWAENPDDILVIVHQGVDVDKVSIDELRTIFLKKKTIWKDGAKALPLHAVSGTEIRKRFVEEVLQLTESEERRYWEEQKIQRGVPPPPVFNNTLKAVFKLRGAVSYVLRKNFLKGVTKVVLVLKK